MYYCSVNHTGVSVQWIVNNTASTDSSITEKGIVTHGAAEMDSNLSIPGVPEFNNTIIFCIASGTVDDESFFDTRNATLLIQG